MVSSISAVCVTEKFSVSLKSSVYKGGSSATGGTQGYEGIMHRLMVALLTVGGLWACGGGAGSSGPVTAPTSPSGQLSPPDVNVGGTTPVAWNGQESHSRGSGSWFLALTQNGAQ